MRVRAAILTVLVMALFPAAASADYAHVVQAGETLTSVAATDGLSIEAIANANGISPEAQLITGQTLWIPPRTAESAAAGAGTATTSTSAAVATATASTTSAEQTAGASDPDADGDTDSTGETSTAKTSSAQTSSQTSPVQAGTQNSSPQSTSSASAVGPVPTDQRVSSADIADVADANGVSATLAEAVAWQESGFNNAEVSSIGAVGVMQIVPTTWSWIDNYLTPKDPLGAASATENIRAGVLLLRQLLQLTGGNEQLAVAGYYQGLASVEKHGMYADTRHYVADVLALAQRF